MITTINKDNLKYKLPEFNFGTGCWIAGGAIRDSILGEKPLDIDIFGASKVDLDNFICFNLLEYKLIYDSEFVKSYAKDGTKIQVIYRYYTSIRGCLESFDYTICQFGYNGENIFCNPEALIHLFNKRLVVNKITSEFSVDSLRRLQKYIKKGYTICNGGINDIVNSIRMASNEQITQQLSFYPDGSPRIIRFD